MSGSSSASDRSGVNSRFEASCRVPVTREQLFAYHEAPGALERLIPPWENVRLESSDRSLAPGSRVVLRTNLGPIPLRWVAVHGDYDPPRRFEDTQLSGPFAHWQHVHRFERSDDPEGSSNSPSSASGFGTDSHCSIRSITDCLAAGSATRSPGVGSADNSTRCSAIATG